MNPAPKDSQGAQHGESVQQAVELVGKMLEQIQVELEKMLSQGGKVPVSSIPVMHDFLRNLRIMVSTLCFVFPC